LCHPSSVFYLHHNQAAEAIAQQQDPDHKKSKHSDIRYRFLWDHFEKGTFQINHIPNDQQIADILTKALPKIKHHALVQAPHLN